MRLRLLNLLLAGLLALSAARLWSALRAPQPQLPPAPAVESPAAPTAAPEAQNAGQPAAPGPEGYETIVARDLFSATRGVVPPEPPSAAKPAPKPPVQPKLTLSGVVIVDGERAAYLQEGTQEARPRRVREGEAFAGGTVKLIRPDGITFLFGGAETSVPLRVPKEAGGAPPPVVPPALMPEPAQRRIPQPPVGVAQPRQPLQAVPGVPRLIPAPEQEPTIDEGETIDEGDIIDEGETIDDGEVPPEDFEEPAR